MVAQSLLVNSWWRSREEKVTVKTRKVSQPRKASGKDIVTLSS
jgi:hypothetical protein